MNYIGSIAFENWQAIPEHFDHVELDEFIVMPNHIHGLIGIKAHSVLDSEGAHLGTNLYSCEPHCRDVKSNVSTNKDLATKMSEISPRAGSLSTIIRSYKGSVTRQCRMKGYNFFKWQNRFYEHIVRNDKSLNDIREYIYYNPMQWGKDDYYISPKEIQINQETCL